MSTFPPLDLLSSAGDQPSGQEPGTGNNANAGKPAIPDTLSLLPLRGGVFFPGAVMPLTIEREATLKMLDETLPESKVLGVIAQRSEQTVEPSPADVYGIGTAVQVLKYIRQSEQSAIVIVQGLQRFAVQKYVLTFPYLRAEVRLLESILPVVGDKEAEAATNNLKQTGMELLSLNPEAPEQFRQILQSITDPGTLADFLSVNLTLDLPAKQALLEELDVKKRVAAVQSGLSAQLEIARIQQRLHQDVQAQFTDAQRRAYLREQVKAIQRELGEDETGAQEQTDELRQKLDEANLPAEVKEQTDRELKRLSSIPNASPEFSVIVSYLETVAELPWSKFSEDNLDLNRAQEILDRDHFGLTKVKRRIIEYLAVRKLNPTGRGPILCFLGPPGVGKTSLGQSIADALGRKFVRISLGGIRDEAEIRGHRRTYIGSMPGRIIQELRRAGTRNPVIMLDELDKVGTDFRGDPASALLEVLDPRQNHAFVDRYLDVPFDLSQVIFIATANYVEGIPAPLRDRMETIEIPGYTAREKQNIAAKYLVRRQLEENGLTPEQCAWEDAALAFVIDNYTREAGVRDLERQVGSVCRAVAAEVARGRQERITVTPELVQELLGPPRFVREEHLKTNAPGVVTGLAYTPVGGEVLYIEAAKFPGRGGVTLTGQLGDVMKESVQAAMSLVRSRATQLGINPTLFQENDIHVHVPAGAVPKDGPSAGIAMFTAIASLFLDKPVRSDVAMTGEVTLRGLVLPIGGLKEKSLAALRAGIKRVLIPELNRKDLSDIPEEVREAIEFVPVSTVDQVLEGALQ
ncbi:ATP-dependent Lon protease [Terrimicrobium sacchariphilum]|uniref:Lon protease n=1 Tax=Terrimicrobium sacchariphilum TaxID=690879 RepID=A0A146GGI1_TERSA|nr:endopeptidase La [Terrimicrobium sacchariphilum]GAT35548.1 ATP-dependent Lon protease [Terrimicrobium sacchariphilum]